MTGWVTAFLAVRCGILHLLASILTMIAAFSINIRIMGRPNLALLGEETILTPFESLGDPMFIRPLVVGILVLISSWLVVLPVLTHAWCAHKVVAPLFTPISALHCRMASSVLRVRYLRKPTFALSSGMFGLQASDLNLVTAVLVAIALIAPKLKGNMAIKKPVNSGASGGKQKSGGAL